MEGNGIESGNNGAIDEEEVTAMHDFIAGGIAGSASVVVGRKFFYMMRTYLMLLNDIRISILLPTSSFSRRSF